MESIEKVFRFLVNRGADITVRTPEGDNLLQLAAKHKNWPVVELMLKRRASPYEPDSEGFSVIHRLAEYTGRNLSALFMLFNKTAVMTSRTPSGETFFTACSKTWKHPCGEIPGSGSKGANPRLRSSVGDTALHLAARHNNWDIVERLVEHGCDLNEPDSEGFYVLHRLAQTAQRRLVWWSSRETPEDTLFRTLLNKGTNVSVRTSAGDSVIQLAAKDGNWKIVERLLELEWDLNELDSEGYNVLHRFAQTTRQTQVQDDIFFSTLLNKGADVSVQCRTSDTALHLSAKCNNWKIARFLAHQGCDMNQPDSEGCYILYRIAQEVDGCRKDR
ncbi:uncharacterized protein LOC112558697 [Pomacea canaliculata]|nr:uncharacterized protein LOC112558697 [Pomacea canaliculata]